MFFETYRNLSQQDRALMDGRLITYHFYVGGVTLLVLGSIGMAEKSSKSWIAGAFPLLVVVFGCAALAVGIGAHLLHRWLIQSPHRDAYLVTLTAAMGRQRFPVLPSLLGVIVVFSIFVTILYILAG